MDKYSKNAQDQEQMYNLNEEGSKMSNLSDEEKLMLARLLGDSISSSPAATPASSLYPKETSISDYTNKIMGGINPERSPSGIFDDPSLNPLKWGSIIDEGTKAMLDKNYRSPLAPTPSPEPTPRPESLGPSNYYNQQLRFQRMRGVGPERLGFPPERNPGSMGESKDLESMMPLPSPSPSPEQELTPEQKQQFLKIMSKIKP